MRPSRLAGTLLVLACAGPARAELRLGAEHLWGVDGFAGGDEVVEYLLCDSSGACSVVGSGDPDLAGTPLRIHSAIAGERTLRARYCLATAEGHSSGDCGPLSPASAPFRYDAGQAPHQFVSLPREPRAGAPLLLRQGHSTILHLPLGTVRPIQDPEMRFDIRGSGRRGAEIRIVVRGQQNDRRYLRSFLRVPVGESEVVQPFPEIDEVLRDGQTELDVRIRVMSGQAELGQGDPGGPSLRAPRLVGRALFGTLLTLFDPDRDGIPTALGLPACRPLEWIGCADNCDADWNPTQEDACN